MATKVADICVSSTGARIVVNVNQLTFERMEFLASGMADVKQKHSLFAKYPMEDDEDVDAWAERILPLMDAENKKLDTETKEEYVKRVYSLRLDKQTLVKDTVGMIAKVFDQEGKVDPEGFKKASYPAVKEFVISVLDAVDLSTKDFE
jgi:hypothetical protein